MLTGNPAEASVNLPLHHWAYEAIERLVALGVIDRAMVIAKPYSRKQAAKYVARAIERIRTDQVPQDGQETVAEPLLARLIEFLRPELMDLDVIRQPNKRNPQETQSTPLDKARPATSSVETGPAPGAGQATRHATDAVRYGLRTQFEADAFSVGHGSVRFRENRGGEYYATGEQVQTDIRGWLELTDALALTIQPKFISNQHVLGIGANDNSKNVYLREFNAKLSWFNIALEIGRGTMWWGPGYHGSLLLTDHPFPLDMIKLGSDEPFRLPWVFKPLGEWKVNSFLAQLERDRDFPRAKVFGLRISYLPASWLELGITRLTQFNGRGHPQSFPQIIFDTYTGPANPVGKNEVNEQVMVDARLRIPQVPYLVPFPGGMQLYGELGGEDHWFEAGQYRVYPLQPAFLVGAYVPQVFTDSTLDLRVEYADTEFAAYHSGDQTNPGLWYNNGTYVSGMRYRGFPLGHHMGTDAKDFFVRTTRYLTDDIKLGVNFNLQRRNLLGYFPQGGSERKTEIAMELNWWLTSRTQLTIGHTYQRIKNPGQITSINPFVETFESGVTSTNQFLWTNLSVEF